MKKILSFTLALMVAFTFMPGITGQTALAKAKVKKPAKVTGLKVKTTSVNKDNKTVNVVLRWKKAKKAKKYQVYTLNQKKTWNKFKIVKKTAKNKKKYTKKNLYKVKALKGKKKGKFQVYKYAKKWKVAKAVKNKKKYTYKVVQDGKSVKKKVKYPVVAINKLVPGKVYKYKVRAVNGKAKGKYSKVLKVKTPALSDTEDNTGENNGNTEEGKDNKKDESKDANKDNKGGNKNDNKDNKDSKDNKDNKTDNKTNEKPKPEVVKVKGEDPKVDKKYSYETLFKDSTNTKDATEVSVETNSKGYTYVTTSKDEKGKMGEVTVNMPEPPKMEVDSEGNVKLTPELNNYYVTEYISLSKNAVYDHIGVQVDSIEQKNGKLYVNYKCEYIQEETDYDSGNNDVKKILKHTTLQVIYKDGKKIRTYSNCKEGDVFIMSGLYYSVPNIPVAVLTIGNMPNLYSDKECTKLAYSSEELNDSKFLIDGARFCINTNGFTMQLAANHYLVKDTGEDLRGLNRKWRTTETYFYRNRHLYEPCKDMEFDDFVKYIQDGNYVK